MLRCHNSTAHIFVNLLAVRPNTLLILRRLRSSRLEGWATNAVSVAHPSRRAEAGAPQDEGGVLDMDFIEVRAGDAAYFPATIHALILSTVSCSMPL